MSSEASERVSGWMNERSRMQEQSKFWASKWEWCQRKVLKNHLADVLTIAEEMDHFNVPKKIFLTKLKGHPNLFVIGEFPHSQYRNKEENTEGTEDLFLYRWIFIKSVFVTTIFDCTMFENSMILRHLIIHFTTSLGMSEQASEWVQQSTPAKRAVLNKLMI